MWVSERERVGGSAVARGRAGVSEGAGGECASEWAWRRTRGCGESDVLGSDEERARARGGSEGVRAMRGRGGEMRRGRLMVEETRLPVGA